MDAQQQANMEEGLLPDARQGGWGSWSLPLSPPSLKQLSPRRVLSPRRAASPMREFWQDATQRGAPHESPAETGPEWPTPRPPRTHTTTTSSHTVSSESLHQHYLPSESSGLNSEADMALARRSLRYLPGLWCASAAFGFWLPLVFFIAAANMLQSCEMDLATFMQTSSILVLLAAPVAQTLTGCTAVIGIKLVFHFARGLHLFLATTYTAVTVYGWILWVRTTDPLCYDIDGLHRYADINPRTLLFVSLILGTVLQICVMFCLCGAACGFLATPRLLKAAFPQGNAESQA